MEKETVNLGKIKTIYVEDKRKTNEKLGGYKTVCSGNVEAFEKVELDEEKSRIDFHLDTGYTLMLVIEKE